MYTILLLGIILTSVYLLLMPFVNTANVTALRMVFTSNGQKDLEYEKEMLVSQIKDIEFDYHTGKLSDEDYTALTREYKLKAASVLKQIDTDGKSPVHHEPSPEIWCHECGTQALPGANYCQQCGASLKGEN